MTALDLFAVPLPSQPTATQVEAAHRLAPHVGKIAEQVRNAVIYREAAGATPREVADELGYDLVTVRARLTELQQAGKVVRTAQRRDHQLVYCSLSAWKPEYGCTPSRRHGAR